MRKVLIRLLYLISQFLVLLIAGLARAWRRVMYVTDEYVARGHGQPALTDYLLSGLSCRAAA
jgi:hypothetical protein